MNFQVSIVSGITILVLLLPHQALNSSCVARLAHQASNSLLVCIVCASGVEFSVFVLLARQASNSFLLCYLLTLLEVGVSSPGADVHMATCQNLHDVDLAR
jgi:hypothetical protein